MLDHGNRTFTLGFTADLRKECGWIASPVSQHHLELRLRKAGIILQPLPDIRLISRLRSGTTLANKLEDLQRHWGSAPIIQAAPSHIIQDNLTAPLCDRSITYPQMSQTP